MLKYLNSNLYTHAAALTLMLLVPRFASATLITFPDQATPNLIYSSIEETNGSIVPGFSYYAGVGTSGEALTFDANNFRVESFGGAQTIDARMSFKVSAMQGQLIDSVTINEGGAAAAFGEGSMVEVQSGALALINNLLASSGSDSYSLNAPATGLATEFWDFSYILDFNPTSEVVISIDNLLDAFAIPAPNGYAFIDKKGVVINVNTVDATVPTPATLALFGLGLAGLGWTRRKKA